MDPRETEHVKEFETALAKWADQRFVTRDQVRALAMFSLYLVNLAEHGGWSYYGHSFKAGSPMSVLVIKATIQEEPVVCFNSGRTFCNCVRIFLRKLEADLVEWRPDQYRV
jgi:hypothetical protein